MDDDLRLDVAAELSWDPKVDSKAIAVSADEGAVALRGTVGSLREKQEAGKAAARVYGVTHVSNELQVRVLDDRGCEGPERLCHPDRHRAVATTLRRPAIACGGSAS